MGASPFFFEEMYYITIILLFAVLCVIAYFVTIFVVSKKGIYFLSLKNPDVIRAKNITSIKIVDTMPKIRFNIRPDIRYDAVLEIGGDMFTKMRLRGEYDVITDSGVRRASVFVRKYKNRCIEIKTFNGPFYINKKNDEQTIQLYEKIISTVEFPEDVIVDKNNKA